MEILLHCVASVSVRFMGNEQGRRVKDYAKTGVSAVRFRCKERGKRVKDRAKNGASMEDRGTGFSVLAVREMKRGLFLARSLTLVPHSLLLNCTKRLLRRLGLDLGAKHFRIRLYGVGCPVPLGGCFLLGGSRISCRSFHCLRSFPLSLSPRHQSPCWHSLCITEIFPYKKEANSRISTKQPNQQTKQLSFTIFLY